MTRLRRGPGPCRCRGRCLGRYRRLDDAGQTWRWPNNKQRHGNKKNNSIALNNGSATNWR